MDFILAYSLVEIVRVDLGWNIKHQKVICRFNR